MLNPADGGTSGVFFLPSADASFIPAHRMGFSDALLITASTTVTRSPSMTTLPTGSSLVNARMCLVHIHTLSKMASLIQVLDRRLGLGPVGHFNKTKTSRLATILVFNDYCRDHCKAYLTESLKNLAKIIL